MKRRLKSKKSVVVKASKDGVDRGGKAEIVLSGDLELQIKLKGQTLINNTMWASEGGRDKHRDCLHDL